MGGREREHDHSGLEGDDNRDMVRSHRQEGSVPPRNQGGKRGVHQGKIQDGGSRDGVKGEASVNSRSVEKMIGCIKGLVEERH